MEKKPKIRVVNLIKNYNTEVGQEIPVLNNLNAEIYDREFVVVVGPSGCGKTTLLLIIAGLEPVNSGEVYLDDRKVSKPTKEMGVIFQETAIFFWRTVIRNAEYGLEMQGMERNERRKIAIKYLKMMNLQDFINSYPKELSGGMKKRLAIAMVYANNPEVLLMDEPFTGLDYPIKCKLQMELLDIWMKEKKTTIFVTHDVEEAMMLADRILVLDRKKIVLTYVNPFERPRKNSLRDEPKFVKEVQKLRSRFIYL